MLYGLRWWSLMLACVAGSGVLLGCSDSARGATLVEMNGTWRWRKGTAEASSPDPAAWRRAGFDDSGWSSGVAPFFYGEPLTGTELPDMRGGYTCVYFRRTVQVTNPAELSSARFRVLSDDGFALWVNGVPVARFNVPAGEIPYTGTASGTFNEPLPTETYEWPSFRDVLVPGANVVAVQAFNASLSGSSDFVFQLAFEVDADVEPPRMASTVPADGARVRELSRVTVVFDEPVQGVDAADLRINGSPALAVTAFGEDQFVFEVPAVPAGEVVIEWSGTSGVTDLTPRRNAFAGGRWTCVVDPDLPIPGVTITEFLAANDGTLNDEDGEASDWIEIENASEETVNLAGWSLTDSALDPRRWVFPSVQLPPRSYLVVFASGKNRVTVPGRLHANFRLAREGGYLALLRPNGSAASEFADYPRQETDVAYGHLATDPLAVGYFPTPTPGERNGEGGPGFAPEVRFSRIGGTFLDPFSLTLTTEDPMATIRFTTNGSVPTASSTAYRTPLGISGSTRVRARAFSPGLLPGRLGAEYYVQLNPSVSGAVSSLPLVVIHSFGRGTVPANGEYPAFLAIHEPRGGVSSMTNAPDLRTRVRLNIRGSSTQGQPKKNYSVEFRDEREADLDLAPLGMPAESDWVLYAPNNFEPILIHNPLAYELSREIGRYAPRTRFVEVYVTTSAAAVSSASYAGIYVLMEKIKRGRDRVDIEKLEPEHASPPEVTGGYLMKVDRLDPGDSGLSAAGQQMGYVDPKEEEMETAQRAAQRNYLRTYMNAFASALNGANWTDPVLGWRPYVDEGSWIDHHLLNVLAFNVDALRLSAYFHKPREGPLVFGPLWDFDRALNSTDGRDSNPRVWSSSGGTDFFGYPWWGRLFRDADFWQHWIDRYQELRLGEFSTNHLFALVDRFTDEVRDAQPREAARWSGFTSPRGSYSQEISSLKTWLSRRVSFMDTNFVAAPTLNLPSGTVPSGSRVSVSGPAGATLYYTLDGSDPRAAGGGIATAARRYGGPITLAATTLLKARAYNSQHRIRSGTGNPPMSSPWSGITTARYGLLGGPEPGDLRITEIHYRPAGPTAAERAADPLLSRGDFEFLELRHGGTKPVDLYGVRMTRGVEFDFSTGGVSVLGPGERVVLVRNRVAFALRYGEGVAVAGEYQGALDGQGEGLRMEDVAGRVLLDLDFRDGWQPATDGLGFSLVARDETASPVSGSEAGAWRVSAAVGGSPGARDPELAATPVVVVNEVLTHTDPPLRDGIELHNTGPWPADVSGWYLTDDRGEPKKYRLPPGTVLAPNGYLWLDDTTFHADPASPTSFLLDSTGDAVWLFAADPETGELTGYGHGFDFGAAFNGVSLGRVATCEGGELLLAQAAWTPGAANAGPSAPRVVLSEVHYHPPDIVLGKTTWNDTALEFVELANVSGEPVRFYDAQHPTHTWRLRDAVSYRFPQGTVLPAGAVALVVNFNPDTNPQARARFQSLFGVAASVPLFGPFEGSLPNGGGRIELVEPDTPQTATDPQPGRVPYVLVDGVRYRDRRPWPIAADGFGEALQRQDLWGPGDRPGAWIASRPTPGVLPAAGRDSDRDGLPDAWEARYCLDSEDGADAFDDSDGDGASNGAEFAAGTDPRDAGDVLAWSAAEVGPGGLELRFRVKAGREYVVESADGLSGGAWVPLEEVEGEAADGEVVILDPRGGVGGAGRYYRVRLEE